MDASTANEHEDDKSYTVTPSHEEEEEVVSPAAVSRLIRSVSHAAQEPKRNIDPFDVHDPNWTLERTLIAAIERGVQDGTGPLSPHVTLAWEDVSVYGDNVSIAKQQDAFSLFTGIVPFIQGLWRKPQEKEILANIDGLLMPGEMLLVLGPPGSGCTTLLKMLSGQIDDYRRWCGSISYSGISLKVMRERFRSMMAFNGAIDHHFAYLTVAQTLEFAASTKTPNSRMNGISRKRYIETVRDIMIEAFGLRHAAHTRVGNDFVRGVSGGERRRVSIAEMASTRLSAYWYMLIPV
jgi:ABC-type transport system involved in cytochrome c biogenesis ATPase subunit